MKEARREGRGEDRDGGKMAVRVGCSKLFKLNVFKRGFK